MPSISSSQLMPTSSVALSTKEPVAFRNMLIIAALHFSFESGAFGNFEKTFLFHRGESIRLANDLLGKCGSRTSRGCMKLIAALCLVEVCTRCSG